MSLNRASYDPLARVGPVRNGNFEQGGVVTQATNRTTGVTINTISGQITTNAASLAAEAAATFTVTNNQIFADDTITVCIAGGSNGGNTTVSITAIAAGSFNITVANQNAAGGTAETGAILITFLVMKAALL